ncbi:hypothetical protein N7481_006513 [Penicillium waksmanii]|uniref:uncharacterized protein n=1 Tax=Penicillium waksmanii TaxID=69791 RepID=UPI0025489C40|nr:uncharacterized protein N7481_006513 [Penicillium waksmanii]KAJ5984414.1 hypothetical protein N7481_006513 [Penicillium waksmanii]
MSNNTSEERASLYWPHAGPDASAASIASVVIVRVIVGYGDAYGRVMGGLGIPIGLHRSTYATGSLPPHRISYNMIPDRMQAQGFPVFFLGRYHFD